MCMCVCVSTGADKLKLTAAIGYDERQKAVLFHEIRQDRTPPTSNTWS